MFPALLKYTQNIRNPYANPNYSYYNFFSLLALLAAFALTFLFFHLILRFLSERSA